MSATGPPTGRASTLADLDAVGVGELGSVKAHPKWFDALEQVGIRTVLDLVTHYPRRYIDRTLREDIATIVEGQESTVLATVRKVASRRTRNGRAMVEIDVFDGSSYLRATFFNQSWRARQLPEGTEAVFSGKVDRYKGRLQMTNPLVDLIGNRTGRIVAIYPESEKAGLSSQDYGIMVEDALANVVGTLEDPLPEAVRAEHNLAERTWSLHQTHLPEHMGAAQRGRRRLGFDELLRLQLILVLRKRLIEREAIGIRHQVGGALIHRFLSRLPFPLTSAQQRALAEIDADLAGPHPMHRLLQGDVGSGKTLVAVAALLTAVEGGHQGAFMAPTEVLAEQHAAGVRALLAGLQVPAGDGSLFADRDLAVGLLTNRTTATERRALHARLRSGEIDILIGTHALLTDAVAFSDLGVIVIDEQHRFGVEQRAALRSKGGQPEAGGDKAAAVPDVLVMTATPIPRTAAMTVFGDLDTTVLDELPPGRTPIDTTWARGPIEEAGAWERVRAEVAAGRQAYVVCPLVEGSEKIQARSAAEEVERLVAAELTGLRLGLLHGQLPARDKEAVMASFRAGDIDVLVATTVIEVGVDVPNATVMVIEDADRFGIAQLHQLRGRVGRGADRSWCYLLGEGSTPEGEARLKALAATTDGFELAEIDLELRGEGTILGTRQKGATDLKLASLRRHRKTVELARQVAFEIVDSDPSLADHQELADEIRFFVDDEEREFLFKS
ncbi:ATP-dependent DNA helicase RecG [Acidiferrimicrobium sp. IK]|uniref:ATP-dependent DNA helicase RecG n=1 Tax=Acidiferrimicrobium sp. IK TaxID=2871700 RepID=UPI0021CAFB83|nr:ATP-dependent DNA helicase RecG [Acidiferrimicrobium sp. IK]MCU4183793.1 ATP-dependent DNA helicase RecG [Acidiferrimicrobium sp. IK]